MSKLKITKDDGTILYTNYRTVRLLNENEFGEQWYTEFDEPCDDSKYEGNLQAIIESLNKKENK